MSQEKKVIMVCAECGGSNVVADAYAEWNTARQDWDVANRFIKGAYCYGCDGETQLKSNVLTDDVPVPYAQILWGEAPEAGATSERYTFGTVAEREAFVRGIQECVGWFDFEVVSTDGGGS